VSIGKKLLMLLVLALGLVAGAAQAQITEVTGFGSNPGGLKMFRYVPAGLPRGAGLVVMIHGCAQGPQDIDDESGLIQMADTYKFAVVFPQTTFVDPAGSIPCYRTYDAAHNHRGVGEALSIKQMTDWMLSRYPLARSRVFVAGFSSGAIMSGVMMASYPDVFAAGAFLSGHPYGCATTYEEFVQCNILGKTRTAKEWGNLVRSAYPGYTGPYPRASIWNGPTDLVIRPSMSYELLKQWTDANGVDQTADNVDLVNIYPHGVYRNAAGAARVEQYSITDVGHAIPVSPYSLFTPRCGTIGYSTQSSSICAVYYVSRWFGLAS